MFLKDLSKINVDTVDGKHASNSANNVPVLDANAKLPIAQIPTGTSSTTVSLGNHTHSNYVSASTGGSITIHADSDSSSTSEYALIKAGHNELKILSSAGGTTSTKNNNNLTFNGNVVYHAGKKPTASEIGAAASSHTHNYAGSSSAGGAANSATVLATARTINGTSFNGSANITTANWGTARNITIGSTTKSVNGSANVAWTLSEIGAAAASHTHSYLPLSGGNVTGRVNVGGRCILPPVYNYDKGALINICAAANQTMVTIHVTGNSYGAGLPINSMYHFYDYTLDGGIMNASGVHNGSNIGNMTVYRNNGRLYAWIKQPVSYQTLNIEIIANKTIDASISNAAVHTSGNTNTITITPSVASMNGHTHNYAGSSSAGGAANSAVKATQDSAGQQINKTYIKGLSVSGKTITYTKGDGTTGTITTQDTNTTYSTGTASTLGLTKLYTGTGTATDGTMTQSAINTALNGKANSSHTHNSITNQDTRNVNTTPTQMPLGLSVHLKSNSADGLNDGGTYHSTLMIKGWNDASGGPWSQITVTANNNLYFRSSNNDTWNAWKKVSLDGHTHNYAAASHTHNYAGSSSAGGNANAAVKLATARTINGTSFNGSANITTANWGTARTLTVGATGKSVNGSGNVSWSWSEMQVPRAYSSSYNFGGNQNAITTAQFITILTNLGAFSQVYWVSRGSWSYASNQYINDTGCGNIHLAGCVVEVIGTTSAYTIRVTTPTTTASGTTNAEFIYINNGADYSPGWRRQYNTKNKPTLSELGAAASSHTHNYAGSSSAGGAANSATVLATARTINGTSFNGSANITTANWGTARTLTIGGKGKSVNGSGNVSWSLSEIGAAAANHSHSNYLSTGNYSNLSTSNKTIVGAINEVFQSADSARKSIASAIGSPLATSDSLGTIASKLSTAKSQLGTAAAKAVSNVSSSSNLTTIINGLNGFVPSPSTACTLNVDFNGSKTVYIAPQSHSAKRGNMYVAAIYDVGAKRYYTVASNSAYGFPTSMKDVNNSVQFRLSNSGELAFSCAVYTSKTYKILLTDMTPYSRTIDETESSYYFLSEDDIEEDIEDSVAQNTEVEDDK